MADNSDKHDKDVNLSGSTTRKGKAAVPEEGKADARQKARKANFTRYMFGDFISIDSMRRNIGFIVIVVVCMLIYIGNGYSSQQEMIELNRLKDEVENAKYNALTYSSELLEKSRQSHIEEYLKRKGDSTLQIPTTQPFVIKVDTTE